MVVGIESIGIKLPSYAIEAKNIARHNGMPEEKATIGLGCHMVGLCLNQETVVDLAVEAAQRALNSWTGSLADIGLIVVGTESSLDESRPLSAWIAERLKIQGHVRSYEVKHACYGGTLALRQAIEWKAATQSPKYALVIAVDICLYEPGHAAEVTQGAGAVAMIVGENKVCAIDLQSYPYSEPCFDFWRPTGQVFPTVDSSKSLSAYLKAAENCFKAFFSQNSDVCFEYFTSLCFHVPFPKMVIKAVKHLAQTFEIPEFDCHRILRDQVFPYMTWNNEVGNAYTASLWISAAQALHKAQLGEKIACFSYGSGFGAELLILERGGATSTWAKHVEKDLEERQFISIDEYNQWRSANHSLAHPSKIHGAANT
jgi:hydroxymethylglutaryl-CoA synthase